ncbi:PREDICTED: uncharacterized protein LOC104713184 [Camelina sativa]|uniref:Uncharacterized protein LOC104713184 n=1 Tax=Camelina sativa TaxID=90675 RepID=A0ABM0TMJ0_CAMSA|nr:PREDICTED: uncharacterized protein LOC104713184 [Camelina sativa]
MKQFEYHGVEAEKAEAMRRYNNRRSFRDMLRLAAVAFLCYLWFSTVAVLLQTVGGLIYRFGSALITDRTVAFVIANLLVVLIFLLSGESDDEKSSCSSGHNEPDLYEQYTSFSPAVTVTAPDEKVVEVDGDSNKQIVPTAEVEEAVTTKKEIVPANVVEYDESSKQIVPAYFPEVDVDEASEEKAVTTTGIYRRTKSEAKKKKSGAVTEYRRTESAKEVEVEMERLSSEEFRLKVESFIMETKRSLIHENDVVQYSSSRSSHDLVASTATSDGYGYGSVSW